MQSSTQLTWGTCENIGGYYHSPASNSTPGTSPVEAIPGLDTTVDRCFYYTFDCPGYTYQGQCYTNKSSGLKSCQTCNNIGGIFATNDSCYYYSDACVHFSVEGQCHTDRYCKRLFGSGTDSISLLILLLLLLLLLEQLSSIEA